MIKINNIIFSIFVFITLCNCSKQKGQSVPETIELEQKIETSSKNIIETSEFSPNTNILMDDDLLVKQNMYLDFSIVLKRYNNSKNIFSDIFVNNSLKILLGDVDLLKLKLDIFSLAQMDNQNIKFIRNMIYAKYGYIFDSQGLVEYFSRFNWYDPKYSDVNSFLTEIDKYNIQLIQMFETRNEDFSNIIWDDPVGVWNDDPPMIRDAWADRFIILPGNTMEYHESQMQDFKMFLGMIGSYIIKGNVLIYSVTEVYYVKFIPDVFSIQQEKNLYMSTNGVNKIILEKPIIFKFPISNIETLPKEDELFDNYRKNHIYSDKIDTLTIGGQYFFKFPYDKDNYIRNW
jgi:hypothetical protein